MDNIDAQVKKIKKFCNEKKPLVVVRCLAYNHEDYIRDALNGFVMQRTSFPFVAVVHDDASTDKTADIIREYAEKYPNIILPIFETENQFSKRDGSLGNIVNGVTQLIGSKYLALCEGDDYWIDPLKLQKQVDFLETHPDYSLCTTNHIENQNGQLNFPHKIMRESVTQNTEEFFRTGIFFSRTASLMFRTQHYLNRPGELKYLYVSDIPLKFYLSLKGLTYFMADITTVYRRNAIGSWSQKKNTKIQTKEGIQYFIDKEYEMLDRFNKYTNGKFHKVIDERRISFAIQLYKDVDKKELRKLIITHPFITKRYFGRRFIIRNLL